MTFDTSSTPIRLLFFTGNLYGGGTEHHLAQLLCRLDQGNFHPELVLLREKPNHLLDQVRESGIQVHDLGCNPGLDGAVRAVLRLRKLLEGRRPEILHSFGYPCDIFAAAVAASSPGVAVLTSRRGNQPLWRRRLLYRLTNPLVDRVISVSNSALSFAERTEGLAAERGVVIPNGVELSRFRGRRFPVMQIQTIGTLGRLRPVKGSDLLLEAFELIGRGDLKLLMAGEADRAWGQRLRASFEGTPGVTFLGKLLDHQVPDFLRLLDLFVLPSRCEGMSNALLEAMASGVPIVATDVGSNRELLADGQAGLLVDPNPHAIAAAIETLVRDPERANSLGMRARERAAAEYGFDGVVERYEKFYSRLLGRSLPTPAPELVGVD